MLRSRHRWLPEVISVLLACNAVSATGGGSPPGLVTDTRVAPIEALGPLRAELAQRVAAGELPSVAIGVLENGEVVWQEALGWADREGRRPATVETSYGLASLGKSITATGVMVLVERGALELDKPVNAFLAPEGLRSAGGHADRVTVRQLLDMTAAIPHGYYLYVDPQDAARATSDRLVRDRAFTALPPGDVYLYSNLDYAVLERLIEVTSGLDFADFLRQGVFDPLEMSQASVAATGLPAGAASRYGEDGEPLEPRFGRPLSSLALEASLHDLLRYGSFQLDGPEAGTPAILSRQTIERMHRERASLPPGRAEALLALGWGSIELEGGLLWLLTNGRSHGAQATLTLLPSKRLAVAVLINESGNDADGIAFRVLDALAPGFLERVERKQVAWESLAYRPYRPEEELLGAWNGAIEGRSGPLELELVFQPDGDIHVALDGRDPTLLAGAGWEEGLLTGHFLGQLPLDEEAGHPHRIELALYPRDGRVEGYATAYITNQRGSFALPAYLHLIRTERPPSAR